MSCFLEAKAITKQSIINDKLTMRFTIADSDFSKILVLNLRQNTGTSAKQVDIKMIQLKVTKCLVSKDFLSEASFDIVK